jgi:Mg-chelatase subunit ChlD
MTWFTFLALVSLLFVPSASSISAEREQFHIRSVFADKKTGDISAIVQLPQESSPKASDFQLLIDNNVVATARETRGLVLNTMFLVDVSGSMKGSKNDSPLEDAKRALSLFLNKEKIRAHDRFALTSFADKDTPLSSYKESREISALIPTLKTEGTTTRLYQAVDRALKNRPKDDPRTRQIYVVISDGKDEDEETEAKHRQLMADSKASLAPIYTVFRGKTEPPFKAVLSELANAAGGRFFLSQNHPQLADALRQIYRLETSSLLVQFTYPMDSAGGMTENGVMALRKPDGSVLQAKFPEPIPLPLGASRTPWIVGISLALLLIAAAIWWLFYRPQAEETPVTVPPIGTAKTEPEILSTQPPHSHRTTQVISQYFPAPAAGQPAAMLRGLEGPVEGQQYFVDKEIFSIGAGAQNDLSIEQDEYISGEHAYLRYEKGSLFIFDKASRNGTFVNDSKLTGTGFVLRPGDRIRIGNSTFEVASPS